MDEAPKLKPLEPQKAAELQRCVQLMKAGGAAAHGAWEKLYRLLSKRVLRFLCWKGMARDQAEDLVQEVMLAVHQKAQQHREGSVLAWVLTIAQHRLTDLRRSAKERHEMPIDFDALLAAPPPDLVLAGGPLADIVEACRRRQWAAYARREPDGARAVVMAAAEGWTIDELSVHLEQTVDQTKKLLARVRAELREVFSPCEPEATR